MTKTVLRLSAIILAAGTLLAAGAMGTQADEFAMANKFYQDKDYESAVRLYQSILNQNVESANLYFNLGNAYFKHGDLGRAVLYYMKARRLAPGDPDIVHNLEFARQFSSVQMEGVELNPIHAFFEGVAGPYRLSALAWLSSLFFVVLMLLLCLRYGLGMDRSLIRIGVVLSLVLLIVAAGLTSFKYRNDYLIRRAVITADKADVYTGPSPQSDVELQGAPGLVVEILSESGEFYSVLFENKRRGWIKKDLVAVI